MGNSSHANWAAPAYITELTAVVLPQNQSKLRHKTHQNKSKL